MSDQRKSRIAKWLGSAALVSAMCACATATGPKFAGVESPPADQSDIYLYRTSAFYGVAQAFSVQLDGRKVADLPNASYARLRVTPGSHVLKVLPGGLAKSSELRILAEAGKAQFFQYDFVTGPLANPLFIGAGIEARDLTKAIEDLRELQAWSAP